MGHSNANELSPGVINLDDYGTAQASRDEISYELRIVPENFRVALDANLFCLAGESSLGLGAFCGLLSSALRVFHGVLFAFPFAYHASDLLDLASYR